MSGSGIEIEHTTGKVTLIVRVGEKTARVGVTPEYAKRLSAELMTAALNAEDRSGVAKNVEKAFESLLGIFGRKP